MDDKNRFIQLPFADFAHNEDLVEVFTWYGERFDKYGFSLRLKEDYYDTPEAAVAACRAELAKKFGKAPETPVPPKDAPAETVPTDCKQPFFKKGDRVVCIDDSVPTSMVFHDFKFWPVIRSTYTVRAIHHLLDGEQGVYLEEINNPSIKLDTPIESAYNSRRFRLVEQTEPDKAFDDALGAVAKAQEVSNNFLAEAIRQNLVGVTEIGTKWDTKFKDTTITVHYAQNPVVAVFDSPKAGFYSATGKTPLDAAQALDRLLDSHIHFAKNNPLTP